MAKNSLIITRRDGIRREAPIHKLSQYKKINRLAIEKNKFQIEEVDSDGNIVKVHDRLADLETKNELREAKLNNKDLQNENDQLRAELEALKAAQGEDGTGKKNRRKKTGDNEDQE